MENQALGQSVSRSQNVEDFRHHGRAVSPFMFNPQSQSKGCWINFKEVKNAVIECESNSSRPGIPPNIVEQIRAYRIVDDVRHVWEDRRRARRLAKCFNLRIFFCTQNVDDLIRKTDISERATYFSGCVERCLESRFRVVPLPETK